MNILKKIDVKRQVFLLPGFYLEQQVSKFYPARMQKKYIHSAQLLCFVLRTA